MEDVTKNCPFHKQAMHNPKNVVEAFSDQFHNEAVVLRQIGQIKDETTRNQMTLQRLQAIKGFVVSLEQSVTKGN